MGRRRGRRRMTLQTKNQRLASYYLATRGLLASLYLATRGLLASYYLATMGLLASY